MGRKLSWRDVSGLFRRYSGINQKTLWIKLEIEGISSNMNIETLFRQNIWMRASVHAKLERPRILYRKVAESENINKKSLIEQIQAGKHELIGSLVKQYSDRLYLIVLRMVQSPNAAEDIIQETWVLVIRKLHQYDPSRPIVPWLTQIAVNCCRSYWRRERLRSFFKPEELSQKARGIQQNSSCDFPEAVEFKQSAERALHSLSPRLREVVVLKFYSGLTYEEIAEILNIPVGTIKSRMNYALLKMRDSLNQGKKP